MTENYYTRQVQKVIDCNVGDNFIRMKVQTNGNIDEESHWLNIPVDKMEQIKAILATIEE